MLWLRYVRWWLGEFMANIRARSLPPLINPFSKLTSIILNLMCLKDPLRLCAIYLVLNVTAARTASLMCHYLVLSVYSSVVSSWAFHLFALLGFVAFVKWALLQKERELPKASRGRLVCIGVPWLTSKLLIIYIIMAGAGIQPLSRHWLTYDGFEDESHERIALAHIDGDE